MKINDITEIKHFNLGTINQNKIVIQRANGGAILYFSYNTLVGVEWNQNGNERRYISHNYWTKTTGKLLNKLEPNKNKRKNTEDFKMATDACIAFLNS